MNIETLRQELAEVDRSLLELVAKRQELARLSSTTFDRQLAVAAAVARAGDELSFVGLMEQGRAYFADRVGNTDPI